MKTVCLTTRYLLAICLCFICLANNAQAQVAEPDSTTLYRIETQDGNEFIGTIIQQNEEFVQLRTKSLGDLTIARKNIRSIKVINANQIVGEEIWYENPQSSRYFFAPNGYGLRKGEGYYQNVWIFFNQASVGVTDNFSIGAGMIPLFLFAGTSTPVWITPKFSVPVVENKLNIGAGALVGTVLGEEGTGFGVLYGIGTVGSRDKNVSVGLGYGFAGGDMANAPVITISGMLRVSKGTYLLTENYIIPADNESVMLLMLGGRSITRKIGIDYGLVIPADTGEGQLFAIPWLGLTVPFGTKPATYRP